LRAITLSSGGPTARTQGPTRSGSRAGTPPGFGVFLVDKLNFSWDEVHDIAEELEHIKSDSLINKLDKFLGFPDFDPHGDPIPNANGEIKKVNKLLLSEVELNKQYRCIGMKDSSSDFLRISIQLSRSIPKSSLV
jgi:hypothetical protein